MRVSKSWMALRSLPRIQLVVALSLPVGTAGHAQIYDFSAAVELLEENLDAYYGDVFVQLFQGGREIFSFQSGGVTADSQLRMGSATKWLSSAVILRLAEARALELDDRIGGSLPIFDVFGKGDVTLRQCFAMWSGLYETTEDYEISPMITLEEAANLIAANTPIVFPPGTQLAYEGDDMEAVGRAAEVLSGVEWRALADQEPGAWLTTRTPDGSRRSRVPASSGPSPGWIESGTCAA